MKTTLHTFATVLLALSLAACDQAPAKLKQQPQPAQEIQAPAGNFVPQVREGFTVRKWAKVPNARAMAVSPDGKLVFVGSRSGWLHKVTVGDTPVVEVFQENLSGSNSVCFVGEDLYLGQLTQVRRFEASKGFHKGDEGEVVLDGLPNKRSHSQRYIRQGPDGRLRMGIGAPCNVCEQEDPRFATIVSFLPDGTDFRIDAKGVRNTVGFDWHPETGDLYFTDNGRDQLGDDKPPCELNILKKGQEGSHYGFPYRWGDNQKDPQFGDKAPDLDFVVPRHGFQAHVAPLGCYFPKLEQNQKALKNQVMVAQHGSWNRSSKVGYRVVTVDLNEKESSAKPFLWGFLDPIDGNRVYGRPVDMVELPDGTILISDDHAGVIWAVEAQRADTVEKESP